MFSYFFFFFFVVKQLLQSYWSLEGALDTVPLFSLTCPLLLLPRNVTDFLGSLLDGLYASGQKCSEVEEELELEEVDSGRGYGVWTFRTILGDRDETLRGGWGGGVRCFGRFGGEVV